MLFYLALSLYVYLSKNSNTLITAIIPAFNEEATVGKIIKKLQCVPEVSVIIFVNDGSTDKTLAIAQATLKGSESIIINLENNQGKGAALRAALHLVNTDYVVFQDADLELEPHDISLLFNHLKQNNLRVVYGNRRGYRPAKISPLYYFGGVFVSTIGNLLFRQNLHDWPVGYKLFEATLLKSLDLSSSGFEICAEITAKIASSGIKIQEIPIRYYPRSIKEGKKLRIRHGLIFIITMIKVRFGI